MTNITASAVTLPTDTLFLSQWHLRNTNTPGVDLNILKVWPDYTGKGIRVAFIDDGFDLTHPDLVGQFDLNADWDYAGNDGTPQAQASNNHGTAVLGIVGAARNGLDTVGVAYGATLVGLRVAFGVEGNIAMFDAAMQRMHEFDVVNNSWGYPGAFSDNFAESFLDDQRAGIVDAALNGRGGLGTNIVYAAGNHGNNGDNVNYHNIQNSPYTITVGAITNTGDAVSYSNPGAALLISAPGQSIYTTDVSGALGYNSGNNVTVGGTSFAAPMVSGVIALMLEANPNLGARDVQEILAYSARVVGPVGNYQTNGADNWNGTGLHFAHSHGFGLVDAYAAVRLAETWDTQATFANQMTVTGASTLATVIPDGTSSATSTISIANDLRIDSVEITIDITHSLANQLDVVLIAPTGTRAVLTDNAPFTAEFPTFTFASLASWGERAQGTWTLEITDGVSGAAGILNAWSLALHGDAISNDDLYIFTDEYAGNAALPDSAGTDTINAAAVSASAFLDLDAGTGTLGGKAVTLGAGQIENAYTGDADDSVRGNAADNTVRTGRGNDVISASAGHDIIDGGAGTDTYISDAAFAHSVAVNGTGDITLTSRANGDTTRLINVEQFMFAGISYDLPTLINASQDAPLTDVTYFIHGTGGIAGLQSNNVGNHAYTATDLNVGGSGFVLLADRTPDHLTLTNNAGTPLSSVSMRMDDGLNLTTHGFNEVNLVADGTAGTSIEIGGGQRGFIQTGAGDDTIDFLAFLIDRNAPAQQRTLTANTGDGQDTVIIEDRSAYLAYDIDLGAGDDMFLATGAVGGTVHGGAGADIFAFGTNNGMTVIDDFVQGDGDRLDLSRLIQGPDPVTQYIALTSQGSDTIVSVNNQAVATLQGTLLSDSVQHYIDLGIFIVD